MKCADCGEPVKECERPAVVHCSACKTVLHAECAMSDPATAKDFCEPCYNSTARTKVAVILGAAYCHCTHVRHGAKLCGRYMGDGVECDCTGTAPKARA